MPALLITAVTNGADTLTIVGHGLVTGDGGADGAAVRNVGDGALPSPLAALTGYWIIRVDNDTIKLATSQANAMLGTAINLTTDGSGTNYLEIGIPFRHHTDYAVGSQVKSADLDSMELSLKAIHALLTDQTQTIWPTRTALNPDGIIIFPRPHRATNWAVAAVDISNNPGGLAAALASSGAGDADFCLTDYMRKGQTLKTVRLWVNGDDAVDIVGTVYKHDFSGGGAVTSIGTATATNAGVGVEFLDINVTDTLFANELTRIWLRVNANAANASLLAIILGT
jgi:hypothetical protein